MNEVKLSEKIEATPEAIYFALTNVNALREWLCDYSQTVVQENGRIYLWWQQGYYAAGEFTELVPQEKVAFSWQGKEETAPTHVSITLAPNGSGTTVALTHSGLGEGEAWAKTRKELEEGWQTGLANLKSVLERGLDKRVYDRPFLGILIGSQVTAEQAAQQGLPVEGGIQLSGTMPDTGAAALDLQNGDILTELGGTAVTDFNSLRHAIQPHRAGDKVKIAYYRDGEKHTDLLLLSHRPVPDLPQSPADFAEQLRDAYDQLDKELDALLLGVTEEEASYHPAEGEWNVKEVLAHLITTERGTQMGLATQVTEGVLDGFPNNPPAWIQAVTAVYKTLPDVVQLWKQTEAETVALVAGLPPEFMKRRATLLNTVSNLMLGMPSHTQLHFGQMQAAIEAARAR